MLASARLSC